MAGSAFGQSRMDLYFKALSAYHSKQQDSAFIYINESLQMEWDSVIALQRAKWNASIKLYKEAMIDITQVIEKGNAGANMYAAKYTALMNEDERSLKYLESYLKSPGSLPYNVLKTDSSFNEIARTPAWEKFWKSMENNDLADIRADISYRLSNKDYNSLFDILDNAIAKYPDQDDLYYSRFQVFYFTENFKGALKNINTALKLNPQKHDYYAARASLYRKMKQPAKAIKEYETELKIYPYDGLTLKELTITAIDAELPDVAIRYAEEYLKYFSKDVTVLYKLAYAWEMKKDYKMALEKYTRALEKDRDYVDAYYRRGMCYIELAEYKKASDEFTLCLDLKPRNGEIFYYRGLARLNSGDNVGACRDFERAKTYGNFNADEYLIKLCNGK